jgi:hypothetical protein
VKLLLGTRLYVDFPTIDAVIYPRKVVEDALNAPTFRDALKNQMIVGGIFDGPHLTPKHGIITHCVTDISIFNDEIVVELEIIDNPVVCELLGAIRHKKAAIIIRVTAGQGVPGSIIRKIIDIECVHIKEDPNAQLNRSDSENKDSRGEECESGPDA